MRSNGRTFPRSAPISICIVSITTIILLFYLSTTFKRHLDGFSFSSSDDDITKLPQHNSYLISYIKNGHIKAPENGVYKLHSPNVTDFSQNGQSKAIAKIFNYMKGGTFLEAGAYNGEELSNSLYLERELGWSGLLVEPDPWNFWSLRKRGRKSHAIQACLSPVTFTREVTFRQSDTMGHIAGSNELGGNGQFRMILTVAKKYVPEPTESYLLFADRVVERANWLMKCVAKSSPTVYYQQGLEISNLNTFALDF